MPAEVPPQDMGAIVKDSVKYVGNIAAFTKSGWGGVMNDSSSPAFSYSATTLATKTAQLEGWKALQIVETAKKLATL